MDLAALYETCRELDTRGLLDHIKRKSRELTQLEFVKVEAEILVPWIKHKLISAKEGNEIILATKQIIAAQKIHDERTPYVAMLALVNGHKTTNNATGSLLHLNGEKVIVTNWHVWDAFDDDRHRNAQCSLQLMGQERLTASVDISDAEVIGRDEALDIVVLQTPPEPIESIGKKYVDAPAVAPSEGLGATLIGFPGIGRREYGNGIVQRADLLGGLVSQVDEACFTFSTGKTSKTTVDVPDDAEIDWGGMSGSLVYLQEGPKAMPCGILKQCLGPPTVTDNGLFRAVRLDVLPSVLFQSTI